MSILHISVPESLQRQVVNMAAHDGVSVEQFVTDTLSEKVGGAHVQKSVWRFASVHSPFSPAELTRSADCEGQPGDCHDHLTPYQAEY